MAAAALAAAAVARQRAGAAAGWRTICALQHAALRQEQQMILAGNAQWRLMAGTRSLATAPWSTSLLPARSSLAAPPDPGHNRQGGQQWQHCWHQLTPGNPRGWQPLSTGAAEQHASVKQQQQPSPDQQQHGRQQQQQQQSEHAPRRTAVAALQAAGWSRREVLNVPNALSMLRLLSGPVIASWILDAQWSLALPALAISGATDWADGYTARRFNQPSVIGSYLDPLADKVLICSVVGALGWSGVLPAPVVAIIVGRDVLLVTGAFAARAKSLGWRWPGWSEFFRVQPPPLPPPPSGPRVATAAPTPAATTDGMVAGTATAQAAAAEGGVARAAAAGAAAPSGNGGSGSDQPAPAAPLVQPLYISKVNTVFQLGLVGTCILHSWLGWPGEAAVWGGSALTAGTTLWSCWAYLQAYRQGRVLAPAATAQ